MGWVTSTVVTPHATYCSVIVPSCWISDPRVEGLQGWLLLGRCPHPVAKSHSRLTQDTSALLSMPAISLSAGCFVPFRPITSTGACTMLLCCPDLPGIAASCAASRSRASLRPRAWCGAGSFHRSSSVGTKAILFRFASGYLRRHSSLLCLQIGHSVYILVCIVAEVACLVALRIRRRPIPSP